MKLKLSIGLLFFAFSLLAQRQKEWGIHTGLPVFNEKLSDGSSYMPYQILGNYTFKPFLKRNKHQLALFLEPQFVLVFYAPSSGNDFEFGTNFGAKYSGQLSAKTTVQIAIGSGPHYITADTPQQAGGFIFSDNFSLGFKYSIKNGTAINLSGRFRHISNANLRKPNKGIDNWFVLIGFSKEI